MRSALVLLAALTFTSPVAAFQQRPDSMKVLTAAKRNAYDGATRRRFQEQERRHPPSRMESGPQRLRRYLDFAAERRERAIRALDEAALELPADDWITGHRIALRILQGRLAEAAELAAQCRATDWLCDALRGATHHLQGRTVEAEAAFTSALRAMPASERCAWLDDLSHVLDGEAQRAFDDADCERAFELQERLWWLADPLHIVEGNERRNEQLFRAITIRLHHEALEITGGECQATHHGPHLRAGWGPWWWETNLGFSERELAAAWDSRGYRFMPNDAAWTDAARSTEDDWIPVLVDTGERYRPTFGSLSPLPHQTAFFRRGDSLLFLSASESAGPVSVAGVALSRNERESPVIALASNVSGTARVQMHVPNDAWLVSVEAVGPRGAFRSRFGHRLPESTQGGLGLSDLLLFEWQDDVEESVEAVVPRMFGSSTLARTREVGVFWEVYGVDEESALNVSLSVRGLDNGLFRRLGEAIGLVDRQTPVSIDWTDASGTTGVLAKSLRLDFSSLPDGRYELDLRVGDGTEETVATRRFEIRS